MAVKNNDKDIQDDKGTIKFIEGEDGLQKAQASYDEYNATIIRDYDNKVDDFYLSKKDPDFEYRFLRDDTDNLSLKTSNQLFNKGGWQICPCEHLTRIGLNPKIDISPDGLCRRGRMVLAFMPKKLYLEKEQYRKKKATDSMKAISQRLKYGDKTVGGSDIHDSMRGIQHAEDLGMGKRNPREE